MLPTRATTHLSKDVEDCDRATEFEVLSGKTIELALGDCKELAHAAREALKHGHRRRFGTPAPESSPPPRPAQPHGCPGAFLPVW